MKASREHIIRQPGKVPSAETAAVAAFAMALVAGHLAALFGVHTVTVAAGICGGFYLSIWMRSREAPVPTRRATLLPAVVSAGLLTGWGMLNDSMRGVPEADQSSRVRAAMAPASRQASPFCDSRFEWCPAVLVGSLAGMIEYPTLGSVRLTVALKAGADPRRLIIRCEGPNLPWMPLPVVDAGDALRISGKLRTPAAGGAESNASRSLRKQGLAGMCIADSIVRLDGDLARGEGRREFAEEVIQHYGNTREVAVVLSANLGLREVLDDGTAELFRQLGLSHLLVVAGYHVALVGALAAALSCAIAKLWLRPLAYLSTEKIAASTALAAVALYVSIVGDNLPTVRGAMAVVAYLGFRIAGRQVSSTRLVLVSFIAMAILFPGCEMDCGVQLTFTAVTGLACGARLVKQVVAPSQSLFERGRYWMKCHVIVHATAALFLSPLSLYWFGGLPVLGVVWNLVFSAIFSVTTLTIGGVGLLLLALGLPMEGPFEVVLWPVRLTVWLFETGRTAADGLGLGYWSVEQGWPYWGILAVGLLLPCGLLLLCLWTGTLGFTLGFIAAKMAKATTAACSLRRSMAPSQRRSRTVVSSS